MKNTTTGAGEGLREAVIIPTRNRPADLRRTLESVARQEGATERLVLVVDGSDAANAEENKAAVRHFSAPAVQHLRYPARPSLPRQRNYGVDHLPADIEIVHFLDDDVTLRPAYFQGICRVFDQHRDVGGVGGLILDAEGDPPVRSSSRSWLSGFFLLTSCTPGRVLPSGHTSQGSSHACKSCILVHWLSGCSASYRRRLLDRERFDETLEGYAPGEDLDLSYRIGRHARLVVEPAARLVHHQSPLNRDSAARLAERRTVHRYWFLEKNIRHPLRKPAFWWSVLGQLLARFTSCKPERGASLRGLLRGIGVVLRRDHPLLREEDR